MRQIDVHKLADDARLNRFHIGVLFWCAIIIICDGYDLAVAGIALPLVAYCVLHKRWRRAFTARHCRHPLF